MQSSKKKHEGAPNFVRGKRLVAQSANFPYDHLYGKGLNALFTTEGPMTMAPFPVAGRQKNAPLYDKDAVALALSSPPKLVPVDPRTLHKTQPSVVRAGVQHYLSDPTSVYDDSHGGAANRYPIVYTRSNGQNIILTGHHRATAALLKGQPLQAIHVIDPQRTP